MTSRRLWKTEKSSVVRRTESVSMIHHRQSVVVSSTAADQTQRNFFFRILSIWLVELPGCRVLQSGGDIGCRLLRRERTSQPDMVELLDGGNCRSINWPCTPPGAEVVANVNDLERQQRYLWSNWYGQNKYRPIIYAYVLLLIVHNISQWQCHNSGFESRGTKRKAAAQAITLIERYTYWRLVLKLILINATGTPVNWRTG